MKGGSSERGGRRVPYARTFVVAWVGLALAVGPATVGAADDAPAFRNGQANAVAQIAKISPGVGSLSLALGSGVAVAQMANDLAQAQSKVTDLGLIGTTLTAQQCDGSDGALRPDQLPQASTVDNRKGDASASSDEIPLAGGPLGSGRQVAEATTTPYAHATVTDVASAIGPLLTLSGGRSDATAGVVDGVAREAVATSSVDIDLFGAVTLTGASWRAFHRTGSDPAAEGSFTVGAVSAGGVSLPVDQLGPLETAINAVLAPSGVTLTLPRVQHVTTPNDFVRVSPLTITLKDSPAGKATIGPGLNLTRVQREQLFDAIASVYCKAAAALLVGDISLSVLSGTGFLTIDIGGAEASSADLELVDPFGNVAAFGTGGTSDVAAPEAFAAGAGGTGAARSAATPGATVAGRPTAATGPLETLCESLHPNRSPGCSKGMGVPIGIAGIGLTVAVGYLDWRRQRAHHLVAATA
jgi:hypothetical protein